MVYDDTVQMLRIENEHLHARLAACQRERDEAKESLHRVVTMNGYDTPREADWAKYMDEMSKSLVESLRSDLEVESEALTTAQRELSEEAAKRKAAEERVAELEWAAEQTRGALFGAFPEPDSVQGKALVRLRSALNPAPPTPGEKQ